MNKYLEKIAEIVEAKDKPSEHKVVKGLAGATLLVSAPKRLLGYHTVYHGTTSDRAESIRKNGLDPKHGGSGSAKAHGSSEYLKNSKDKVHVTKRLSTALQFAAYNAAHSGKKPSIVMSRVSDKTWQNMKGDKDMGDWKYGAATTKHKIDPKYIVGGEGSVGIKGMLNGRRMGNYYKSPAGKFRALRGLGMAVGGGALLHNSVKPNKTTAD